MIRWLTDSTAGAFFLTVVFGATVALLTPFLLEWISG